MRLLFERDNSYARFSLAILAEAETFYVFMPLQVAGDGFAQLARSDAVNDLYLFEIAHNRPVDKIIDLVQRLGNGHAEKVDFKLWLRRGRRIGVPHPDFAIAGQFCALFWRIYLLQVGNFAPRFYAAAGDFHLALCGIYGEHLSGGLKFYKENIVADVKIFGSSLNVVCYGLLAVIV